MIQSRERNQMDQRMLEHGLWEGHGVDLRRVTLLDVVDGDGSLIFGEGDDRWEASVVYFRAGYAPDGGLYVPETLPRITAEDLDAWRTLDFTAVAVEVLLPFLDGEVSREELAELLSKSYAGYDAPDTIPVTKLTNNTALVELFHGPTLCFKDLGLQVAVRLLALFARRRNEPRTLLVATTGDTGPAALRAVADVGDVFALAGDWKGDATIRKPGRGAVNVLKQDLELHTDGDRLFRALTVYDAAGDAVQTLESVGDVVHIVFNVLD